MENFEEHFIKLMYMKSLSKDLKNQIYYFEIVRLFIDCADFSVLENTCVEEFNCDIEKMTDILVDYFYESTNHTAPKWFKYHLSENKIPDIMRINSFEFRMKTKTKKFLLPYFL